jgi:Domain of unknown function (DUF4062)
MITKPAVFVSSTSKMTTERQELRKRLPSIYELYLYEWDRAGRGSPEERCRAMLEQSDVFVGVLGPDYGSLYPGQQRSIVEWEFDTARELGKLAIFTFVKSPEPGETREQPQEAFLSRIGGFTSGVWMHFFATPTELAEEARDSLESWLAEVYRETKTANRPLAKRVWIVAVLLAILAIVGLGAVLALRGSSLSTPAIIILCACTFVVVAGCLVSALFVDLGG